MMSLISIGLALSRLQLPTTIHLFTWGNFSQDRLALYLTSQLIYDQYQTIVFVGHTFPCNISYNIVHHRRHHC